MVPGGSQGNLIFIRGVGNFSFTPNSDPAAVAPSATSTCGRTAPISAASQGRHAVEWAALGFSWIRRLLPRTDFHRKCLTALVT